MAIQETMQSLAMEDPPRRGVFLFEDHKIARATFLLPPGCSKVTTRAFLLFLERGGWLDSAVAIERRAIEAGRSFRGCDFRQIDYEQRQHRPLGPTVLTPPAPLRCGP